MEDVKFENCSDEQLAAHIKSGDYAHFFVLRNRYMPYIIKSASKYKSLVDEEDLISEGVLALFVAAKSYKQEKSSFKAFAFLCIERAIVNQYRRSKALKRIPAELISSIDGLDIADSNNPESLFIEKESTDSIICTVKDRLSDYEYKVFCEFICGKSYKEIAQEFNKSNKSVDNALKRVRAKIAGFMVDNK
ncbi:MAG: sigma-70 family RNA polymerase sigma factor [Clostridia bacterium]|nr:sigma-70 family RNA polymerase sigma factor [Clostridia bacterium]